MVVFSLSTSSSLKKGNKRSQVAENSLTQRLLLLGGCRSPLKTKHTQTTHKNTQPHSSSSSNNNNNNTIWGGSVLTGEEPPPHSGELKHALLQAGGPTQSQLSRPMSSGHHISMEHRLRRKQLNSDTNASKKIFERNIRKRQRRNFFC